MPDGDRNPDEERAEKGEQITDRLSSRFQSGDPDQEDTSQTAETAQPSQTSKSSKTSKPSKTDKSDTTSVKDRPSVLMYLPEGLREDLDVRFDELNARHKRAHGEALEKNRDYYPAVVEAGLEGTAVEDVLDL